MLSDDFACRHVVFLGNLGPWALERSDLTQSRGSGGRQPPGGLKKYYFFKLTKGQPRKKNSTSSIVINRTLPLEKQSAIRKATTKCRLRRHPKGLGASRPPPWVCCFCISGCFSDDFGCRHAVFLVNLGPWALERSDLAQSGRSGGRQPPGGLKKTDFC